MKSWKVLRKELLKNKKVTEEYKKLEPRYQVVSQLIQARIKKGLTQKDLADKIGVKQSAISRVESGTSNPTLAFLGKLIQATDSKLVIQP